MDWEAKIERRDRLRLIGMRTDMSFAENQTRELWQSFRPRVREIAGRVGEGFYSVQYYENFEALAPNTAFSKWACVEVTEQQHPPVDMEAITLSEGLGRDFCIKVL
ncbi:MAG: GyrI-like domain-containing protein [Bacteroidota bacterium]